MLGGADNPNGELPSYITGANNDRELNDWPSNRVHELLPGTAQL